jgi:hypothetical protein
MNVLKTIVTLGCYLAFAALAPANAATVSFTFLNGSSPSTSLNYMDSSNTYQATLTGWADTLGTDTLNESAVMHEWSNSGLGVCSSGEGTINDCLTKKNRPPVDNGGDQEWILIYFSQVVNLTNFTIVPDGNEDRDVTFFTGWLSNEYEVANKTYTQLVTDRSDGGLGLSEYNADYSKSTLAQTVDIAAVAGGEVWGNAILVGASRTSGGDRWMLEGLSTVVPLPAGVWLFASAIAALAGRRKLQAR